MMLKEQKLDVTDRVTGKLKGGEIVLYLENERIGKITLPQDLNMELSHEFEGNGARIYQHITAVTEPDAKYTDCDEGGWC